MDNQRIAMRTGTGIQTTGLYFLFGDHPSAGLFRLILLLDFYRTLRTGLGSTSLVLNSSGTIVLQTKYKPWGEVRSGAITLTDFGFTGQRQDEVRHSSAAEAVRAPHCPAHRPQQQTTFPSLTNRTFVLSYSWQSSHCSLFTCPKDNHDLPPRYSPSP